MSTPLKRRLAAAAQEALFLGLHHTVRFLPTEACSDVGARLSASALGRRGFPVAEARIRTLLTRLRPDWAAPDLLDAAVGRVWENVGRCYAEYSVLPRIVREGRVEEAEPGLLESLAAPGPRPTIFGFLHLGNWELVAHRLSHLTKGRGIGLAMTPASPIRARIFRRWHESLPGVTQQQGREVWRDVIENLRRPDGALLLAIDEPARGTAAAPFFGRPPHGEGNLSKAVRLAAASGARVIPVYAERLPGVRFRLHALAAVEPPPAARVPGPAEMESVLALDAVIGPAVRRLIDQWHLAVYIGKDVEAVAAQAGPPDLVGA